MKKKYILPTTVVLMLQASTVLNDVSNVSVDPDEEGDQSEAESRSLRHRSVWDDV
jgi:hypothetical protein